MSAPARWPRAFFGPLLEGNADENTTATVQSLSTGQLTVCELEHGYRKFFDLPIEYGYFP
jgi:hypothetical protein